MRYQNGKIRAIESFDFPSGRVFAHKYEVLGRLGAGWEGEVYRLREVRTGIERAAKFFYPQRNVRDKAVVFYAKKLHKLQHCPIVIQYRTQEHIQYRGVPITFLVSDYVEGELLNQFLARQRGHRLSVFEGLHLLHALATGVERIHQLREYHGDLHSENVIIRRRGIGFDLKLIDMFHWVAPKKENIYDDVCDLIRLFYDAIGGQKHYANQPQVAKQVCCGLKRSLITKRFRTAGRLREYLENLEWE